jgi:DNA-directed RNA polymerase subunit RPC12/RpoP
MDSDENISKKYICHICNKQFASKRDIERHSSKKYPCSSENPYKCDRCGKVFDRRSNLNAHINKKTQCQAQTKSTEIQELTGIMHEMLKKQNSLEYKLENNANQTQSIETQNNATTSHSHNTTNSNNNSNNTNMMNNMSSSYLIQYVVNNYPNAKNIEDCIKLENIPKMTLTECEDLYFTDGAMKIFKGLCDLGEEYRPIHCTDASRGNYIYKTNDVWKIDVGGEEIRNYFFPVIQEAYTQVHKSRIKDNPGNSSVIGNYLIEMTGSNVKKVCQKTLKRLSNHFLAKNSKNSRLMHIQNRKLIK